MLRRFRLAVAAGSGLAVLGAVAPAPAADDPAAPPIATLAREAGSPQRPPLDFVIQDDPEFLNHPERLDATLDDVKRLGFTYVRLSAKWSRLTRAPDARRRPRFAAASPGGYEQRKWRALDRAVTAATRHGLNVMIDVSFYAPRWAVTGPDRFGARPRNAIDQRAFTDFAVAIARRYSGLFPVTRHAKPLPRVRMFTLWNEPNLAVFWTPQRRVRSGGRITLESPHAYRRLVQRAYSAVKRARPDSRILVGGLASGQAWKPRARQAGIPAMRFIREMACVNARLAPLHTPECRHFQPVPGDGLAAHPYSLDHPPYYRPTGDRVDTLTMGNVDTLALLLRRLVARGRIAPGLEDIYLTEFGYLTPDRPARSGLGHRNPFMKVSPERQAVWESLAHQLAWQIPQVRMFSHFLVRDTSCVLGSSLECIDWPSGFRYPDGSAKPIRTALEAALLVRQAGGADVDVWGRLGDAGLRDSGVLEYRVSETWRPVPREYVSRLRGGGEDGIFSARVNGTGDSPLRIAAG